MSCLFGGVDVGAAVVRGSAVRPVVTAPVPDAAMRGLAGRVGTPLPVGNEGAGTVVAAGESAVAQALLGKVVAAAGGGMYSPDPPGKVAPCPGVPARGTAGGGAPAVREPAEGLGLGQASPVAQHRPAGPHS